jgi:hypothetical protein
MFGWQQAAMQRKPSSVTLAWLLLRRQPTNINKVVHDVFVLLVFCRSYSDLIWWWHM